MNRFAKRQFQDLFGAGSERYVPSGRLAPSTHDFIDFVANLRQSYA